MKHLHSSSGFVPAFGMLPTNPRAPPRLGNPGVEAGQPLRRWLSIPQRPPRPSARVIRLFPRRSPPLFRFLSSHPEPSPPPKPRRGEEKGRCRATPPGQAPAPRPPPPPPPTRWWRAGGKGGSPLTSAPCPRTRWPLPPALRSSPGRVGEKKGEEAEPGGKEGERKGEREAPRGPARGRVGSGGPAAAFCQRPAVPAAGGRPLSASCPPAGGNLFPPGHLQRSAASFPRPSS